MATTQRINETYYVRFKFRGVPYRKSLEHSDKDKAEATRKRVEVTLHDIKTGLLPPPPPDADVPQYVLSGGKLAAKVAPHQPAPVAVTVGSLWEDYLVSLPPDAKEESSLKTERGHFNHLRRILKEKTAVAALTINDLQRYINRRAKEDGFRGKVKARTIKKEIATLRAVWNQYALPRKIVPQDFKTTFGQLRYSKEEEKPPFQTWEQIERQVSKGGLTRHQLADLWDCLFLDLDRIHELLEHVRGNAALPAWVYPAFVAAAHTGCRRGEIIRSEATDWDDEGGQVRWRERKKDRSKKFTFRPVQFTPLLARVWKGWKDRHPGGRFAFCNDDGGGITRKGADHWFNRAVEGSKWEVLRGWHVLRHSFVSCMASKGVDQRIIDASVGHQTEEMRRRYRHLFPRQQESVLAAVFGR